MLERLADLEQEYEDVLRKLSDPAVIGDQRALRDVSRRHKEPEPTVQRSPRGRSGRSSARASTGLPSISSARPSRCLATRVAMTARSGGRWSTRTKPPS